MTILVDAIVSVCASAIESSAFNSVTVTTEMDWIDPADLVEDRPEDGVFRVHRAIFDDPAIFDLEIKRLFEGGWVFLGLSSQAALDHDFFTTTIGRVPILVMRDGKGVLGAFVNACPHKGAMIAQTMRGNARLHVCAYHSWTFDSAGKNKGIKWKNAGA